jgi:hypothetical protein
MRTIYIDSDFQCYPTNDGTLRAIETDFFDGKCDTFVYGYRYDDSNGYIQIYPCRPFSELDKVQREYEKQQLEEYKNIVAEQDLMILDL